MLERRTKDYVFFTNVVKQRRKANCFRIIHVSFSSIMNPVYFHTLQVFYNIVMILGKQK